MKINIVFLLVFLILFIGGIVLAFITYNSPFFIFSLAIVLFAIFFFAPDILSSKNDKENK